LQWQHANLLQTREALNNRVNELEIEQKELFATRETLFLLETENGDLVKRLQAMEARNEEIQNCLICFEHTRELAFDPCGHLVCCVQCAKNIRNQRCPICRKNIKRSLRVHIP